MIWWWRDGTLLMFILIDDVLSITNFQLRITAILDRVHE